MADFRCRGVDQFGVRIYRDCFRDCAGNKVHIGRCRLAHSQLYARLLVRFEPRAIHRETVVSWRYSGEKIFAGAVGFRMQRQPGVDVLQADCSIGNLSSCRVCHLAPQTRTGCLAENAALHRAEEADEKYPPDCELFHTAPLKKRIDTVLKSAISRSQGT